STVFPFRTEGHAQVTMRVGDRQFGPVQADRQGHGEVPIDPPPGGRQGEAPAAGRGGGSGRTHGGPRPPAVPAGRGRAHAGPAGGGWGGGRWCGRWGAAARSSSGGSTRTARRRAPTG